MLFVTKLEAEQAATIKAQALQIDKLTRELLILKRRLFGRSSEAADILQVQGQLFAPPATIARDSDTSTPAPVLPRTPNTTAASAKQRPKRELLPAHLPREQQVVDLSEADKVGLVEIGRDQSERLAYRPGTFYVLCTVRPRYVNPQQPDAGVQQMPAPPCAIPSGILDLSVLVEFIVSKFADHIPLSRQIDRIARLGVELSLSTVSANLLTIAQMWLKSIVDALWIVARQRGSLHVDETVFPTLPERGSGDRQTKKTRLWTYLNDTGPPIILFHYTQSKAGQHVQEVLSDWKGPNDACTLYLHADAASNYEALYRAYPRIQPVNCWAHARRKFYAIAQDSSVKIFAHEAVEQIDVLFAYEREWKALSTQERFAKRQTEAQPQLEKLHAMLIEKQKHLGGSDANSATAQAISYLTKRWANFTRYTEHGDLVMSNNAAERALRKAALGRKNFLFAGNERGGEAAAIFYSLIETAKANGIEPNQWLLKVLREFPKRNGSSFHDVKDLLPIQGAAQL
jgi:transposase